MLAWTIYLSFLGAAVMMLLPRRAAHVSRVGALIIATAGLGCGLAGSLHHDGRLHEIFRIPWIPQLGIQYYLAADGISLTLVLLTGIAAVAGVLFSWNIAQKQRQFFALYFALIGGVYGVFLSFDLFLLFVFYEIAIIPKYFLIAIWGSTRREYGAMKLVLYSFFGSALVLVGIITTFVVAGGTSMALLDLAGTPLPHGFQLWAFPLIFVGFGILAGLWPFHTWAPTGHVAAPTAASMLLAGVVMKLGAYGCLRVALALFPHGLDAWSFKVLGISSWGEVFALLAVVGVVYGAAAALVQRDFKFVIGYSSVSHMGFVLLGLMTLNQTGINGAVLQMFSHGVVAGLLFAVVGRMVYDRTHTRDLEQLGKLRLSRAVPFAAVIFTLASAASMGMPGFSGFISELQILIGAWKSFPTLTVFAGAGIVLAVAYSLRALQGAFFGQANNVEANPETTSATIAAELQATTGRSEPPIPPQLDPISLPERAGALILIAASIAVGLFPELLLRWIRPALNSPFFDALWRMGGTQ